jgi:hypothetical protein
LLPKLRLPYLNVSSHASGIFCKKKLPSPFSGLFNLNTNERRHSRGKKKQLIGQLFLSLSAFKNEMSNSNCLFRAPLFAVPVVAAMLMEGGGMLRMVTSYPAAAGINN